jgi:glycosyltransferase involved in cell wall biosynthesis
LKVALNATCFNDRSSGAKQRFLGIYRNLAIRMPKVEFVIFEPVDCPMESWFNEISNIQTRRTPIPSEGRFGKLLHASRFWSQALEHERFSLFEGFHLPIPKTQASKTVLTVHDIRSSNTDSNWLERIAFRHAFARSIKNADLVVTVSEAMKREIQRHCDDTPIKVIPNGLETSYSKPPTDSVSQAFRRKFCLAETFILAVGHLERRKNYLKLIDAIAYLRAGGLFPQMVIIGNDSGERGFLEARIAEYKLNGQIIILSGLSDVEVRCAYDLCSLFVFPSTYEGFGIPILEAMAAARPIALADIPVFREITEGRSAYFSPENSQDIAQTIKRVLSSPQEQARLIKYGQERVQAFTYENIGAQYEKLYESLLGSGNRSFTDFL